MFSFITITMLYVLAWIFTFKLKYVFLCFVSTGREEISKAIGSKTDLLDLCHRLDVKPSVVLKIMDTLVTFPPHIIGRSALKMLKERVHQGGARERLLEVAQAFRFNDAAVKIAEGNANYTVFDITLNGGAPLDQWKKIKCFDNLFCLLTIDRHFPCTKK